MKRRLLQLTFALGLLLMLAATALWVTSFWVTYTVEFERSGLVGPEWADMLGGGLMGVAWGGALRRARRAQLRRGAGQCVNCGYDLRGAAHERCPECGRAIAAAARV